jgi:hypothetical protein
MPSSYTDGICFDIIHYHSLMYLTYLCENRTMKPVEVISQRKGVSGRIMMGERT